MTGRPVSAREAERHSLPMWPHVERAALGEWELRTDPAPRGRLIKRANSCLALGDPGRPLADAADAVRDFYAARGRPPLVQVERGSSTEAGFTGLGWAVVPGGDADFLLTTLDQALARARPGDGVEVTDDGTRVHVVRRVRGVEVGWARGALDDGWLAVHGLGVAPAYRGQGHASALLAALLTWGAAHGASRVWLHVETDNDPALRMYAALGFRAHHGCRYLAHPSADASLLRSGAYPPA